MPPRQEANRAEGAHRQPGRDRRPRHPRLPATPAIGSVAVYAEPDRDALSRPDGRRGVRARRQTRRPTPTSTSTKILDAAERVRRRRRPPRLRLPRPRTRDFAQAVIDAGLTWIGPSAAAIARPRRQGRRPGTSRMQAGAPLVPGTPDPVERRRTRCVAFAEPSTACRWRSRPPSAAAGAASRSPAPWRRSPSCSQSAVREAVRPRSAAASASSSGILDKPRHVEAQVPGRPARQRHRRRHPRLLAAAPAPEAGRGGARAVPHRRAARADPRRSAKAICARGRLRRRGHGRVPGRPDGDRLASSR